MSDMTPTVALLDTLCPMHLCVSPTGHVTNAGPTAVKVLGDDIVGDRFLEAVELQRPTGVVTHSAFLEHAGSRLRLRTRQPDAPWIKGVLVPTQGGGCIINLSLSISLPDSVARFGLTGGDFAVTDLAMEMLFLVEAKTAAMSASRKLNLRLQGAMVKVEEQAYSDVLTGLSNRRAVEHVLPRLIAGGGGFSVMQMDLDYFKAVNDTLGHAAGDHVLRVVSEILRAETRECDCVARMGGDEFLLIFAEMTDPAGLTEIADRIIAQIERPIEFDGAPCKVSASAGIAISDLTDPLEPDRLLEESDTALYAAKHAGRACHRIFDPTATSATEDETAEQVS